MTTVTELPPQRITDYWMDGLKFLVVGRKSATLRAIASDPELIRGFALLKKVTEEEERTWALGVADAIDELTTRGVTPEKAYYLASMDKLFGCPFSEFDPDRTLSAA